MLTPDIVSYSDLEKRRTQNRLAKRRSRLRLNQSRPNNACPPPPASDTVSPQFHHEFPGRPPHGATSPPELDLSSTFDPTWCNQQHPLAYPAPASYGATAEGESFRTYCEPLAASREPMPTSRPEPSCDLYRGGGLIGKMLKPIMGTPLHIAAALGHTGVVQLLVSQGANIDAVDQVGLSPLDYAIRNGKDATAVYLLDSGAKVDSLDPEGYSRLYRAAEAGSSLLVSRLLQQGVPLW